MTPTSETQTNAQESRKNSRSVDSTHSKQSSKLISNLFPRSTLKRLSNSSQSSQQKLLSHKVNDRKAMKTLTFLLGAFIICWTPWNIAEVVNGIWGSTTVNYHLYQVKECVFYKSFPIFFFFWGGGYFLLGLWMKVYFCGFLVCVP